MSPDKLRRGAFLAARGVSSTESALLNAVHYVPGIRPAELADYAHGKFFSLGEPVTEEECQAAIPTCLAKGWLRIMDELALSEIARELEEGGVFGPVLGLPRVGDLDFTQEGARLWQLLLVEMFADGGSSPNFCSKGRPGKRALFYRSLEAALRDRDKLLIPEFAATVSGPHPIGPWRNQWWCRYPEGYRLDLEPASQADTVWPLPRPTPRKDVTPQRLGHILRVQNITPGEWAILSVIGTSQNNLPLQRLAGVVAVSAERNHSFVLTWEECQAGLNDCLTRGWVRILNDEGVESIRSLLRHDPTITTNRFTGSPGQVDFTRAGAKVYQRLCADCFGPDWDAEIRVEKTCTWKDLCYFETEEQVRKQLAGYITRGVDILSANTAEMGSWCARWWDSFPRGYRLEVESAPREDQGDRGFL